MKRTPIRLIALVSTAALTLSACGGEESEENSSESTSSSSSSEAGGDESSEGGEQSSQEPSDGASGSSADPSSSGDASGEAQDADGKKPDPEAAGTLDDLEISGGDKPSITFGDGPFTVSETQDKAVEEGDGEELTTDHTAMVEYALYNGTSGKELQNAFGQNAVPIGLNDEQTIAALRSAMEGKKVGSTIAVAIPAKDAFGEEGAPQLGLEAGDTVVYLMKVTEASKPLKEATGTEKEAPEDFPKAEVFTDKAATITMPDSEAPTELKEATLIEGEGDEVKKGDQLTIHYTGVKWKKGAEGEKFDSSHDRGAPTSFPIGVGRLIPGWDETLVGKKVGSRVELIVPPDKGYGEEGMPNAGIEGDDTLVFVVDILDAQSADGDQEDGSGEASSE